MNAFQRGGEFIDQGILIPVQNTACENDGNAGILSQHQGVLDGVGHNGKVAEPFL